MLQKTIELARQNPIKQKGRNSISRFAAILTNGRSTWKSFNSYKSHPLQKKFGTTEDCVYQHAELAVIIQAIRSKAWMMESSYYDVTDLSDCKMYVARVLKDGTPDNAKPCIGCQRAISAFNIRSVEWTT